MTSMTFDTPLGPFTVLTVPDAVVAAGFTGRVEDLLPRVHPTLLPEGVRPDPAGTGGLDADLIAKAVAGYFDGDLAGISSIPVRQVSSGPFRAEAWRRLREVPPGRPVTYTRFAELAGRPAAVRAAASACARNAVALFVPCHRVVRTDGGLGGYLWGVPRKRWLLRHEAAAGG